MKLITLLQLWVSMILTYATSIPSPGRWTCTKEGIEIVSTGPSVIAWEWCALVDICGAARICVPIITRAHSLILWHIETITIPTACGRFTQSCPRKKWKTYYDLMLLYRVLNIAWLPAAFSDWGKICYQVITFSNWFASVTDKMSCWYYFATMLSLDWMTSITVIRCTNLRK